MININPNVLHITLVSNQMLNTWLDKEHSLFIRERGDMIKGTA